MQDLDTAIVRAHFNVFSSSTSDFFRFWNLKTFYDETVGGFCFGFLMVFLFIYFGDFSFQWRTSSVFLASLDSVLRPSGQQYCYSQSGRSWENQVMVSKWCASRFCPDPGFFAKSRALGAVL